MKFSRKRAEELHREACRYLDESLLHRKRSEFWESKKAVQEAWKRERAAADLLAADFDFEPSRSMIHMSAASLAIECKEFDDAGRLISQALKGRPTESVAKELELLNALIHVVKG